MIVSSPAASRIAIRAATTFRAAPVHVAPRMPDAGIIQNPAARAPTAAPAVFAAYSAAAPAALFAPLASTNHAAASGNVAPIATAGTPTSRRPINRRIDVNRKGVVASA